MQSLTYDWANAASTCDPEAPRGPSLLLELDTKDGQAVFSRHVAGMLRSLNMRYCIGRNAYLSFTTDGSIQQLENMFTDISLTTNDSRDFDTIIAVDITALAEVSEEKPMRTFLTGIKEAARYAAVLFLVRPEVIRSRSETDKLIQKVSGAFDSWLQVVKLSQSSAYELMSKVMDCIDACNIEIENSAAIWNALEQFRVCSNAKQVSIPRNFDAERSDLHGSILANI